MTKAVETKETMMTAIVMLTVAVPVVIMMMKIGDR